MSVAAHSVIRVMTMRAQVVYDSGTASSWGERTTDDESLGAATAVKCFAKHSPTRLAGSRRSGDSWQNSPVHNMQIMMPKGTSISHDRYKITSIEDREGNDIFAGEFEIVEVLKRTTHLMVLANWVPAPTTE